MKEYLHVEENQKKYLDTFFNAYQRDNLDLSSENEIVKLSKILNINIEIFFNGIKKQSVKDELKNITNDAFLKEVFGVSTFIINNKFFGDKIVLNMLLKN